MNSHQIELKTLKHETYVDLIVIHLYVIQCAYFYLMLNFLTILVMGKGGVGKSSTVNSIIGDRVVSINPFQV